MTAMLSTTTMTRRLASLLDTRDLIEWEAIRALGAGSAGGRTDHDAYRAADRDVGSAAQEAFRVTEYRPIVTQITIVPAGQTLNDERATRVALDDDGAGAFVIIAQDDGAVRIDPDEWPSIQQAIERMIGSAAVIEQEHGHD